MVWRGAVGKIKAAKRNRHNTDASIEKCELPEFLGCNRGMAMGAKVVGKITVMRTLAEPAKLRKNPERIPEDQKRFRHHSMKLERVGEGLFGKKYYKAIDRSDMQFWRDLYIDVFEVLRASVLRSIGSIDPDHRRNVEEEIKLALEMLRATKTKDEINADVIASLFNLVFLLLGRKPYAARTKVRDWSTFRTLTYSQTEEQLSHLLRSYVHRRLRETWFR